MKVYLMIAVLSTMILAAACAKAPPEDAPVMGKKPEITHPVFFSYAWPIGPDTERDFTAIDMDAITVIDIGPDSLSYPPSIRKHYPKEVFDRWHNRGKILVRRCYDRPFGENNKKIDMPDVTVEALVARWSTALEERYVDGISIDEFIKKDPVLVGKWVEALRTTRMKYPDKLIFCWIAGKGLDAPAELHVALNDCVDYVMPEIYYRESQTPGFPDFRFVRFNDAVEKLKKNAPGIEDKIIMGIAVNEKMCDDTDIIDYMDFVEAQIRYIRTDPLLKKLPGMAFYAPMKLGQVNIGRLDDMVKRYFADFGE
ncbi:hypothetical protein ACFL47_06380 [Candidatus Latescibacterota bacterium]